MSKLEPRIGRLENKMGLVDSRPRQVFILDEGDTLPPGVDASDDHVLVIRLVGVEPASGRWDGNQ
jgi:hypothetical protein